MRNKPRQRQLSNAEVQHCLDMLAELKSLDALGDKLERYRANRLLRGADRPGRFVYELTKETHDALVNSR